MGIVNIDDFCRYYKVKLRKVIERGFRYLLKGNWFVF